MTNPAPASFPSPALFAGRRRTPEAPKSDSSTPSSDTKVGSERPVRKPRLLVNHPELEEVMTRLKEDEQINKKHGWYDRGRNGKKPLPKGTKPNPPKKRSA